ncbi:AcrR family transcriptional regulator [Catenulispora sp. MAP12-49]|jgi:AcrR family transcriptional regulator|uniref:TetR family transcriptional regulator n=1 Tax=unclassified Catenulispora TaxID=414885 RepID=UPI00351716E4
MDSTTESGAGLRRRPMQRRSAERYERILNVCAELLDEVGFAGLTTTAVAKRAEVPIGTVYQFFADKSALVHALAARNLENYMGRLERRYGEAVPRSVEEVVDVAIDEFVDMRRTLPGFGVLDFGAGSEWSDADPRDLYLLDENVENNTAVAKRLRMLTPFLDSSRAGTSEIELALRVTMEAADAVLQLAFRTDPEGDPTLIAECKKLLVAYLGPYYVG